MATAKGSARTMRACVNCVGSCGNVKHSGDARKTNVGCLVGNNGIDPICPLMSLQSLPHLPARFAVPAEP